MDKFPKKSLKVFLTEPLEEFLKKKNFSGFKTESLEQFPKESIEHFLRTNQKIYWGISSRVPEEIPRKFTEWIAENISDGERVIFPKEIFGEIS